MTLEITKEFSDALELLNKGNNLFLTRNAGTGKSTLIRHYMKHIKGNVVVVAPTGIAALNVGGYTLHRLFNFQPSTTLDDIYEGHSKPGRFEKVIKGLQTLIIDEAAMVRADTFDMMAASLKLYGPKPGKPFGGVQIVLVGDLYQLPPVVRKGADEAYINEYFGTPYFSQQKALAKKVFR